MKVIDVNNLPNIHKGQYVALGSNGTKIIRVWDNQTRTNIAEIWNSIIEFSIDDDMTIITIIGYTHFPLARVSLQLV